MFYSDLLLLSGQALTGVLGASSNGQPSKAHAAAAELCSGLFP
jgi:hypothetical protein